MKRSVGIANMREVFERNQKRSRLNTFKLRISAGRPFRSALFRTYKK